MSGGNDRRISKAPPPIKPVQGGSYPVPAKPETPHRPNWKEWNHTPEVRVWEACALSLDIDPHSMVHIQDGWMAGPGSGPFFEDKSFPKTGGKKEEYELRLRVLSKNLSNRAYFSRATHRMDGPYRSEVPLHEFAAWAVSVVQWNDLPSELRALAQSPTADQADEKDPQNADASIAKLFDLVGTSQLEKMFPTNADQ